MDPKQLAVALAPAEQQIIDVRRHPSLMKPIEGQSEGEWAANIIEYCRKRGFKGIFFLDAKGERFVYGNTISLKCDKSYRGQRKNYDEIEIEELEMSFLMPKKTPRSLKKDKIPTSSSPLFPHSSENGWNLPRNHRRHLFNLPQEILDNILKHVVCVAETDTISPKCVSCNRTDKNWSIPHYDCEHPIDTSLSFAKVQDRHGQYFEVSRTLRATIDATCLRVCKKFLFNGRQLLYGLNVFKFDMCSKEPGNLFCFENPNRWSTKYPYLLYGYFQPTKPRLTMRDLEGQNTHNTFSFSDIRNGQDFLKLTYWMYCDPFLRFLHSIGPRNAMELKTICFRGVAVLHDCAPHLRQTDRRHRKCIDDLVSNLRLYLPFIRTFCPGLRRLVIQVDDDKIYREDQRAQAQWKRKTVEGELRPVLESDLTSIKSLRDLEVIDYDGKKLGWADGIIQAVKARGFEDEKLKLEKCNWRD